VSFELSDGAD